MIILHTAIPPTAKNSIQLNEFVRNHISVQHEFITCESPCWLKLTTLFGCGIEIYSFQSIGTRKNLNEWLNNLKWIRTQVQLRDNEFKSGDYTYGAYNPIWQKQFERGDYHVIWYAFVLRIWHFRTNSFFIIFSSKSWFDRFKLFDVLRILICQINFSKIRWSSFICSDAH